MITQGEVNIIEQRLANITPGEWRVTQTASRDWWITAPRESDSDYVDEYEPIFESSGNAPQFGVDAEFIATAAGEMRKLLNSLYELLADR